MKEGWWINYVTSAYGELKCAWLEHEMVIRDKKNQDHFGIPQSIAKNFHKYEPVKDRVEFLTYVMKSCPLMRVRGHGDSVTFEYWSEDGDALPYSFITKWIKRWGGPALFLVITNLATNRNVSVMASDWDEFMEKEG